MSEDSLHHPGSVIYEMLTSYGFNPGDTVYKIYPNLTKHDLSTAQTESTYSDPKSLRIDLGSGIVNVHVQTLTSLFVECKGDDAVGNTEFGHYQHPDWVVEGWLISAVPTPESKILRARMYLLGHDGDNLQEGYFRCSGYPENQVSGGAIQYVDLH